LELSLKLGTPDSNNEAKEEWNPDLKID
jgi:hypothetical protein